MSKFKKMYIIIAASILIAIIAISIVAFYIYNNLHKPENKLIEYTNLINEKNYEKMYELLDSKTKNTVTKEDFVLRNRHIYEGIDAENLQVNINRVEKNINGAKLFYETTMDTISGNLKFSNTITMSKEIGTEYAIEWNSNLIFPDLDEDDLVRVKTTRAKRGDILDRNGIKLATDSVVADVGVVPNGLEEENETAILEISKLLEISPDYIKKKLKDFEDKPYMFISLKSLLNDDSRISALSQISLVQINDKITRGYPFGEEAAHLTGYVQSVTAEDLEKHKNEGYTSHSVLGKSGLEKTYENVLRGIDGAEIYIQKQSGKKKKTVINKEVKDGTDLKLTIDSKLQSLLYNQINKDKGVSVAMNPNNGEVLALVSTPAYNPNDFVLGLSNDKWNSLNNDENKPMYNRFQATLVPGSSFKPFTAAVGLESKKIDPDNNKSITGLSWKKDNSWGNYSVTRVHSYEGPSNLSNALIYSDNIYFAQAALDIGTEIFKEKLLSFGFNEKIPFEFPLYNSQIYSDSGFKTDIQLADSGYGQGEMLINPVHLAALYTMYQNNGDILAPHLLIDNPPKNKFWKENVISKKPADIILQDLIQVVENPNGTGHPAMTSGLTIAGKTGTAEIKASQTDTTGTELGWFVGTTLNKAPNNLLVVMMVEDVKERGGSGYVTPKVKKALETACTTD